PHPPSASRSPPEEHRRLGCAPGDEAGLHLTARIDPATELPGRRLELPGIHMSEQRRTGERATSHVEDEAAESVDLVLPEGDVHTTLDEWIHPSANVGPKQVKPLLSRNRVGETLTRCDQVAEADRRVARGIVVDPRSEALVLRDEVDACLADARVRAEWELLLTLGRIYRSKNASSSRSDLASMMYLLPGLTRRTGFPLPPSRVSGPIWISSFPSSSRVINTRS